MGSPHLRLRALLVVLATVLLAAVAAAPAVAKVPAGWLGVAATDGNLLGSAQTWSDETVVMKHAGVQSVRLPLYWNAMQPFGPGPVDFTSSDVVVAAASRQGLRILPIVAGTPAWAAQDDGGRAGWSVPRVPSQYGDFLSALAMRYAPGGTFWSEHPDLTARPIRTWQVWNEPNLTSYWPQQPFAKSYVALLRVAREALRKVDNRGRIMLAGFPNQSWLSLQSVYKAKGRSSFDVAAVHAYTANATNVIRLVDKNRDVMRKYNDAQKPIAVTEMGFSSAPKSVSVPKYVTWNTTQAGQAKRLTELYSALAAKRTSRRIEGAYWYSWYTPETATATAGWEDFTGLRHQTGGVITSKPALSAFAKVARKVTR